MQLIKLKWRKVQVLIGCNVSIQGKYARSKVIGLLPMLFNDLCLHNYLPCKLMETIIFPIIKNKKGLSTNISKICWIDYSFACISFPLSKIWFELIYHFPR